MSRSGRVPLIVRVALVVLAAAGATGCAMGAPGASASAGIVTHEIAVSLPRPATLRGDLYRPGGAGPFPAVILLHGCGGLAPATHDWAQWLQAEGYVALVLDSFGGRGLRRICADPSVLSWPARAPDVSAAAAHLRTLPFVAEHRIGAIGFSHGGGTVLYARAAEARPPETPVRAFVAFYPPCPYDVSPTAGTAPLLMLLGEKDDWAPAALCTRLADMAARAGRSVTAVVYPGARHAFDAARLRGVVVVPDGRRGQGATIAYDPQAHADAEKRIREFLAAHLAP